MRHLSRTLLICAALPVMAALAIAVGIAAADSAAHAQSSPNLAPMTLSGLIDALKKGRGVLPASEFVQTIQRRGVSFEVTASVERQLQQAGATSAVVQAARANYRGVRAATPAPTPQPTTQSPASQQTLNAPARLLAARKLYYTPTAQGLKSFHCKATVDWKAMLTRFSGGAVDDDNPFLVYLKSVQFTVKDTLDGDGSLTWTDTTTAPANLKASRDQMHDGLVQMIGGFYQSWNQFVNGGMVPAPDTTTTETNLADGGLHMHGKDATTTFDEDFDRNMLLLSAHVVMPTLDNTAYPTFEASTDGLRVNRVRNVLHQPPTAAAQEVIMAVTYMPVGAYQLPSTLAVTLAGTGEFDFSFNSCVINQ
jgi:hypothetical protein